MAEVLGEESSVVGRAMVNWYLIHINPLDMPVFGYQCRTLRVNNFTKISSTTINHKWNRICGWLGSFSMITNFLLRSTDHKDAIEYRAPRIQRWNSTILTLSGKQNSKDVWSESYNYREILKRWNQNTNRGEEWETETNYWQNEITGGDEGVLDVHVMYTRAAVVGSTSCQDKVRRAQASGKKRNTREPNAIRNQFWIIKITIITYST